MSCRRLPQSQGCERSCVVLGLLGFSAVPSSAESWSLPLPPRFILLPGAASPTQHPGLRGRRRLPRLSHEASRGPVSALPPSRPPALRPHPRRWSRGGRRRGSTFAALAAPVWGWRASLLSRAVCVLRPSTSSSPARGGLGGQRPTAASPELRPGYRIQNGTRSSRPRAYPRASPPEGAGARPRGLGGARAPGRLQALGLSLAKFLGAECGRVGVRRTRLAFPRVKTGKFRAGELTLKTGSVSRTGLTPTGRKHQLTATHLREEGAAKGGCWLPIEKE